MSHEEDEALKRLLRYVAKKKGYAPLTPTQAQAEYNAAAREELSKEEIDRIVRRAVSDKPPRRIRLPLRRRAEEHAAVDEEQLVLNRNAGVLDPETARKLEELRNDALEEDVDDDDEVEPRLED